MQEELRPQGQRPKLLEGVEKKGRKEHPQRHEQDLTMIASFSVHHPSKGKGKGKL